jgi:hypothetical protein
VFALVRESAEGLDQSLVLVNTDVDQPRAFKPLPEISDLISSATFDLLGQELPPATALASGEQVIELAPGAAYCLSPTAQPRGLGGDAYRRKRAQAAWAIQAMASQFSVIDIGPCNWSALAEHVDRSPSDFLASLQYLDGSSAEASLGQALENAARSRSFPKVVHWTRADRTRVTPVPAGHWLLMEDDAPFRASLFSNGLLRCHVESIAAGEGHIASFPPRTRPGLGTLTVERYSSTESHFESVIRAVAGVVRDRAGHVGARVLRVGNTVAIPIPSRWRLRRPLE